MSAFEAKPFQTRGNIVTLCLASNDLRQLSFFRGTACLKDFRACCFGGYFVQRALTMTAFTTL
ncbi:hypothetical protein [Nitratireductor sp. L15S-10]|uniref:hypothetical protein n=1 Tax=Nitratireductor sp. L15S-10 TaxID=3034028 RepID=UPI0038571B23